MFRTLRFYVRINKKYFHTNSVLHFNEPERSGYPVIHDRPLKKTPFSVLQRFKEGCRDLKEECTLLAQEARNVFRVHKEYQEPNENIAIWKFDGSEKSLYQWIVTCDSDYAQGYSTAKLELSPHGTGLFHGVLSTKIPKDGEIVKAGYCNITTAKKVKSFQRPVAHDWSEFNSLVLRIKGDGRCYMLNILQRGPISELWYSGYHYVMYTRGGPYWQTVTIPFSKFVYGYRGVIQDSQIPMSELLVTNFGITVADRKNGPYRLEIDYIAVCQDMYHNETFAYEMVDQSLD